MRSGFVPGAWRPTRRASRRSPCGSLLDGPLTRRRRRGTRDGCSTRCAPGRVYTAIDAIAGAGLGRLPRYARSATRGMGDVLTFGAGAALTFRSTLPPGARAGAVARRRRSGRVRDRGVAVSPHLAPGVYRVEVRAPAMGRAVDCHEPDLPEELRRRRACRSRACPRRPRSTVLELTDPGAVEKDPVSTARARHRTAARAASNSACAPASGPVSTSRSPFPCRRACRRSTASSSPADRRRRCGSRSRCGSTAPAARGGCTPSTCHPESRAGRRSRRPPRCPPTGHSTGRPRLRVRLVAAFRRRPDQRLARRRRDGSRFPTSGSPPRRQPR